jgi:MFS family permease
MVSRLYFVIGYRKLANQLLRLGTKFTLPTITQAMGFTGASIQLMSAPPYVAGAISAVVFARISDRYFWRMPFVAMPMVILIISYAIFLGLDGALESQRGAAYFAAMLTCIGIFPIQAAAASWNANNIAPEARRAIAIALNNCAGNTGGIIGSFMYIDPEKPKYHTGFGLGLALGATGLMMCFVLEGSYKAGNAKKAKVSVEEAQARYKEEELKDMGDSSPLFKYVL